ncbi:uncharacterized protein LOC119666189 [Teleopsis dalmanni]|uniref:uncharacterized protein LOC119666189 n=1 Tax=Teleopsis dalmanni TaxID=139649 RepID=UPI0018CF4296|nr:uncharacterized protein LOC119666189 [Teleopsis dalmanni]
MNLFILLCISLCPAPIWTASKTVIKTTDKNVQKNKTVDQKNKREAAAPSKNNYHGPSHKYLPPSSVGGYDLYSTQHSNSVGAEGNDITTDVGGRHYDGNVKTYIVEHIREAGGVSGNVEGSYYYGSSDSHGSLMGGTAALVDTSFGGYGHNLAQGNQHGQSGQKFQSFVIPVQNLNTVQGSILNNVGTSHAGKGGFGSVDHSHGNDITRHYSFDDSLHTHGELARHFSQQPVSNYKNSISIDSSTRFGHVDDIGAGFIHSANNLVAGISNNFGGEHSIGSYKPNIIHNAQNSPADLSSKSKYYDRANFYSTTLLKDETPIYALGHKGLGHFSYISSKPQGLNTNFIGSTHSRRSFNGHSKALFNPTAYVGLTFKGSNDYNLISSSYRPQILSYAIPQSSGYDYQAPTNEYTLPTDSAKTVSSIHKPESSYIRPTAPETSYRQSTSFYNPLYHY